MAAQKVLRLYFCKGMPNISKHQVLLFLGLTAAILGVLSWVWPEKGLNLGIARLQLMGSSEILRMKTPVKKDITDILLAIDTNQVTGNSPLNSQDEQAYAAQLQAKKNRKKSKKKEPVMAYTPQTRQTLTSFFATLDQLKTNGGKIRILHYGDSQIEGDRMTSFIRQKLQERYGGSGPGLIPATNIYPTLSFVQKYSPNFIRFTCFGGPKLSDRKYGVMNSVSRFTPEFVDSSVVEPTEAWIEISPGTSSYALVRKYNIVKLFYNNCKEPCALQVYQNDELINEENLVQDGAYHSLKLTFNSTPAKLKFVFKARVSPNIMGFSLEGESGLQVDNVGMRGSSGTFFGSVDKALLAKQMNELNTQLVIMQFGGNSIPYINDKAKADNFAKYIAGNLRTLKKLNPAASIVFIGPSDISTLKDGVYQTYPMLPYVVECLKKATAQCGVPYFDLYEAMGGENSMPSWVEQGLAGKDYIHFTHKGASYASQMFYNALFNPLTTTPEN